MPCTAVKESTSDTPPPAKKAEPLPVPPPSESALLELDALRAMLGPALDSPAPEDDPDDSRKTA